MKLTLFKSTSNLLTKAVAICAMSALPAVCKADATDPNSSPAATTLPPSSEGIPPPACPVENYFITWFDRVSKIQAEQPSWITPLVTVTPRLEEELRYDQSWENLPGGKVLTNYGNGKGLEIIPARPIELIFGVPARESENTVPHKQGWADETFLLKYRFLSANEQDGNYILTGFMGLSRPTGSADYTEDHYVFTPTIAFGKGWGDFDFQSTLGVSMADNGTTSRGSGTPVAFNTAFQYRVMKFLWPELEVNSTYWPNGKHERINNQGDEVFLTPGLLIGRFPLAGRVALTLGLGYQIAVSDRPLYHNNLILTARLPF